MEEEDSIEPISSDELEKDVLPMMAVKSDAHWHPIGTAFVVAVPDSITAFLLTAAHNLHRVLELECGPGLEHPTISPEFRAKLSD